jgi:DNA primase catalytic subunit
MVGSTGPELIDALVRVREAAGQAAERARETIAAVIPESAAALGEASRKAIADAVNGQVHHQLTQLELLAERTLDAARRASERLTRQMLTIGETTAAVEERIDDARRAQETKENESFSRRVALLIESLNSTAIDVTKILSNEVTDSAWAAYLKGDRGVFTRRAVRLIEVGEAREILAHYEAEPEFREQVNRYIHDFEAMLRRVLADRDSSALGVTLLGSDMGKLYVALAQAIERIRA